MGMGTNSLNEFKFYFQVFCALGVLLSAYGLYVEINVEMDKDYKAYCDISETISCTKAFFSKWGKGFGIVEKVFGRDSFLNQPNSLYGILFYITMGCLGFVDTRNVLLLQIILALISNIMSVYLGYILYFELHDFCVVCVSTYIINAIILVMCSMKWNLMGYSKCATATGNSKTVVKAK